MKQDDIAALSGLWNWPHLAAGPVLGQMPALPGWLHYVRPGDWLQGSTFGKWKVWQLCTFDPAPYLAVWPVLDQMPAPPELLHCVRPGFLLQRWGSSHLEAGTAPAA